MSQLRYDPLGRRWVIIAIERARRPEDFIHPRETRRDNSSCPFCPGNEAQVPPEIASHLDPASSPDNPRWLVRVVPNKFPALTRLDTMPAEQEDGLYRTLDGHGDHEVVIETPDHSQSMPDLPLPHLTAVLRMYQSRLRELLSETGFKYALIFKNHGSTAGASLTHPHSQIISTPITPRTVQIELVSAQLHYFSTNRCMVCDLIRQELDFGGRVVYNDNTVIAYTSYAARFPFETVIAPLGHHSRYEATPDAVIGSLAKCLKDFLGRLRSTLDDPPFNFILHTAPNTKAPPHLPGFWETLDQDYHWHLEVIPRLTRTAGFEWGSGLHINPMPPEQAAQFLLK